MILREKVKPSTKSLLVPVIVTTRNLSFGCLFSLNKLTRHPDNSDGFLYRRVLFFPTKCLENATKFSVMDNDQQFRIKYYKIFHIF